MTSAAAARLRPMAERYVRPEWVQRVNAMAEAAGGAEHVVPIDADELLAAALGSLGTSDPTVFGDLGDGDWEGRFRALVAGIADAGLHVVGRLQTREELLRCLRTRAHLHAALAEDPAIADEEIRAPMVVTGPARSGTTILFELLGLDPELQVPTAADVLHPAHPAGEAERLAMTSCEQELWADVQPEFAAIHELRSDLPVECVTIGAPSFAGPHWTMVLEDLGTWLPDAATDLRFHRLVLQTTQRRRGSDARWLLKTPGYLMVLDELFAAYPDAEVVVTHRDPAKTMPSTVSTTAMVRWLRADRLDLDGLSALIRAVFVDAIGSVARRRAAGEWSGRFGDVRFRDLMTNPVDAVRRAYAQLGRPLADDHATAILDYLRDKPQGKFGRHAYTAEDWGFGADEVRSDLAEYLAAYDVDLEP